MDTWKSKMGFAPHEIHLTGVEMNSELYNEIFDAVSYLAWVECQRNGTWRGHIYLTGIPRVLDTLSEDGTLFQWTIT